MAWAGRFRTLGLAGGLALICVILAAVVAGQLKNEGSGPIGEAPPSVIGDREVEMALPRYELPPFDSFAELVERPLFSSTRRPVAASAAPAQVAASPQGLDITLKGVIVADDSKVAIIEPRNAAKPVRLNKGQSYQGWTLSEVDAEGVIFRQGTRAQILELDHKAGAALAER